MDLVGLTLFILLTGALMTIIVIGLQAVAKSRIERFTYKQSNPSVMMDKVISHEFVEVE